MQVSTFINSDGVADFKPLCMYEGGRCQCIIPRHSIPTCPLPHPTPPPCIPLLRYKILAGLQRSGSAKRPHSSKKASSGDSGSSDDDDTAARHCGDDSTFKRGNRSVRQQTLNKEAQKRYRCVTVLDQIWRPLKIPRFRLYCISTVSFASFDSRIHKMAVSLGFSLALAKLISD